MSSLKVRVLPDRTVEIEGGDPEEVRRILSCFLGPGAPVAASPPPSEPIRESRQRGELAALVLEALRLLGPAGGSAAVVCRTLAEGGHIVTRGNVSECLRHLERRGSIKRSAAIGEHPGPWYGKAIAAWVLVESAKEGA